ncbi:protein kinase [Martiniozyma asiatica (nom. inval.)]|nr:protein kinase [Martiniozyma asiatica]
MVSPSSLGQLITLANATKSVAECAISTAAQNCSYLAFLQSSDDLYRDSKLKSEEARAKAHNRPFNATNVAPPTESTIDIFDQARLKSQIARKKALGNQQTRSFHTTRRLNEKDDIKSKAIGHKEKPEFEMSQSAVPSSRLGRLFHYGSLAASMGAQVIQDSATHYVKNGATPNLRSLIMSPKNIERMARKFSQMRGAALKVGQMLSFQDSSVLPPEIQQILLRVQNSAHYMPTSQLERTISFELGDGWRGRLFASFDDIPIAAASIGQVHTAVTRKELEQVVVKVQYPGVADSIDSDLDNILTILTASKLLPPGLFLEKSIANARVELKWECDYIREAQNLDQYRHMLKDESVYRVPKVYHELSDEHVLTMERMKGTEIVKGNWDQGIKNFIAHQVMRLCLLEIYKFKFMQTDPNWANFLYNDSTNQIELLDFGACRSYPADFIKTYANTLRAAVKKDREAAKKYSIELGFLTGLETEAMINAHVDSILVLGEPFRADEAGSDGKYDFKDQTITDRVRTNIKLMLNERLTPPPEETYSLHRKLSGAYLLCARMNANINTQSIFEEVIGLDYE